MNKNHLIALLSFSALLLAVLLVILPPAAPQARADSATLGDYTMIAASNSSGGDDYLTVIDNHNNLMLVYQLTNPQGAGKLNVIGSYDLNTAFH